jgi:hypothetical protein
MLICLTNLLLLKTRAVVVVIDRIIVGFTTTYAIRAYYHKHCVFESGSCEVYSIQCYVIKLVKDLRQVGGFLRVLRFPPSIKLTDITEIL